MNSKTQAESWWGQFNLPKGEPCLWKIGPLSLSIMRTHHEWQIATQNHATADTKHLTWNIQAKHSLDESVESRRFVFSETQEILHVIPMLADRPVVIRPLRPFTIAAEQQVTMFVSTPVWVGIEVHEPAVRLEEFPITRPSDTWFGPSTLEGELCYAEPTQGRLQMDEVPFRPHRAVTPVLLWNRSAQPLLIDKLSLPVPYLALYKDSGGMLWTDGVSLHRDGPGDMAKVTIDTHLLGGPKNLQPLSQPRTRAEKGMLVRAFSALFQHE